MVNGDLVIKAAGYVAIKLDAYKQNLRESKKVISLLGQIINSNQQKIDNRLKTKEGLENKYNEYKKLIAKLPAASTSLSPATSSMSSSAYAEDLLQKEHVRPVGDSRLHGNDGE